MTDKLTALRELADKVEAGVAPDFSMFRRGPKLWKEALCTGGFMTNAVNAWDAYNGSRDAVKALRNSLLPGVHVIIWGHKNFCVVVMDPEKRHLKSSAVGECEARAELLAILRQLISQEEDKG